MEVDARGRTAITLGVLAVVLVAGLVWAWSQVTEPYPAPLQTAPCSTQPVQVGESLTPSRVMVSVLNAGGRNRLARDTIRDLADHGFGYGEVGNAPANAATSTATIWADPDDAAAQLVASYLGPDVEIVDQPSTHPGITVLVGGEFGGVSKGKESVTASTEGSVCVPNDAG